MHKGRLCAAALLLASMAAAGCGTTLPTLEPVGKVLIHCLDQLLIHPAQGAGATIESNLGPHHRRGQRLTSR